MAKAQNKQHEMPKAYEPGKAEQRLYQFWMEKGKKHATYMTGIGVRNS